MHDIPALVVYNVIINSVIYISFNRESQQADHKLRLAEDLIFASKNGFRIGVVVVLKGFNMICHEHP